MKPELTPSHSGTADASTDTAGDADIAAQGKKQISLVLLNYLVPSSVSAV